VCCGNSYLDRSALVTADGGQRARPEACFRSGRRVSVACRSVVWRGLGPPVLTVAGCGRIPSVGVVDRYRSASEQNDIDALMQTLSDDAELISPLSGHMVFRGRDDLRVLLNAVYGTVTGLR